MTLPVGSITGTLRLLGASEFNAGIVGAQRSMDLAAGAATKMAGAVNESQVAMTRNGAQAAKLRALSLSLTAAEERHSAAVMSGNASTAKLAATEAAELRARVRLAAATDSSTRSVAAMGSVSATAAAETSTFAARIGSTVEMLGKLGLAFGVFELAKRAIDIGKQAADFQRQMLLIETVANASSREVKNMTSSLLAMSGQVATAPDQLALSLYHVEQNGLRGAQALDVVKTATEGAKIGMADVEATTNSMTSAVASGIKGVQNMDQAMGALLATAGTGDMKMSDLNDALSNGILTVAKTYGLSLKDVGAALAVFGDLNMRGTDAASQLRQAIMAFAKPAVGPLAKKTIDELGMTTSTLAKDMQHGGLNQAVTDLRNRLTAAGITGDQVGKALLDLFGKRAGIGVSTLVDRYDRLQRKYAELDAGSQSFADKWAETQKTAGFALDKLGAEAQAAGIKLAQKLLPAGTEAAKLLGAAIPAAISLGHDALQPFIAGWDALDKVLVPAAHAADDVAHAFGPVAPVLKDTAAAALAMWLAWRGYQVATTAVAAVRAAVAGMALTARADLGAMGTAWRGLAAQSTLTNSVMQVELAKTAAAEADQAEAQLMVARAFQTASAEQIEAMEAAALVARSTATSMAGAAATAAGEIELAGDAASVGWKGLAGPAGIAITAVVGLATLIPLLRRSGQSAQDAAAQINTYTQAIKDDSGALAENTRQAAVNALDKAGALQDARQLGVNLAQVTNAVLGQGNAYKSLHGQLEAMKQANADLYHQGQISGAELDSRYSKIQKLEAAIGTQNSDVRKSVQSYKDQAAALATGTNATNASSVALAGQKAAQNAAAASAASLYGLVGKSGVSAYEAALKSAQSNTAQTKAQTLAFQMENNAAGLVNQALQTLAGQHLNNAQAQTALDQATLSLDAALKKNGSTLAGNTAAGVANRQAIEGAVSALQAKMTAEAQATGSTKKATAQYRDNAKALLDQIGKLDGTKSAAYQYAKQLLKIPPVVPTKFDLKNAQALRALSEVKASVRDLASSIASLPSIDLNKVGQRSTIAGHARGGSVADGLSVVGEDGFELLDKHGSSVQVVPHGAAAAFMGAASLPGYASGTAGAAESVISRAGSHGLAGRLLFQEGDMLGRELIAGLQMRKGDLIAATGSVVSAMATALGHAHSLVARSVAASVAPTPTGIPKLSSVLSGDLGAATTKQQHADVALANYKRLYAELQQVTSATDKQVKAANDAVAVAKKNKIAVDDNTNSTEAERKAAAKQASDAEQNAQRVSKAAKARTSAVSAMVSKAKSGYQSLESAAKSSAQVAQQAAASLVAAIQSRFDALQQNIQNLESTVSSGLTGGSDLSTIWGNLGTAVQTASDNLDQAKQALASAQDAVAQATPDTSGYAAAQQAVADATQRQTAAHQALTAALAGGNAAQILAAQQAQTDAATNLAAAQAAAASAQQSLASQSGPTADQIQAVATAQDNLTAAQQAYTAAKQADSASGVASVLSGFKDSEQQFSTDLTHLKSMIGDGPAAQALITQLAGLGDQAGDALAQGLINDPASLKAIVSSMQQIQSIADGEGTQLATSFYGAGIASMEQLISGVEAQFPSVVKALQPLAAQLAAMFTITMPGGSTVAGTAGGASSKAASLPYYLVKDTANGKWYDVNPGKKSVHELTAAQLAADQAAGASVHTRTSGVPHFAGGVTGFAGGLAVVGEFGPELVRLPPGSDVIPANRAKGAAPFAGTDLTPLVQRLDRIEARLADAPRLTGAEVASVGASLYERAGRASAAANRRAVRQGAY